MDFNCSLCTRRNILPSALMALALMAAVPNGAAAQTTATTLPSVQTMTVGNGNIFDINFDMTGCTIGYESCCCTASEDTMHAIEYLAKVNNYPVKMSLDTYGSDSTSFATAGVPACTFARLNAQGGAQIHNHTDTMDRIDPDSFMITLNFVALFADQLANAAVNPLPRKFAASVNEKLEMGRKFAAAGKEEKKDEEAPAEEKKEETEEAK